MSKYTEDFINAFMGGFIAAFNEQSESEQPEFIESVIAGIDEYTATHNDHVIEYRTVRDFITAIGNERKA